MSKLKIDFVETIGSWKDVQNAARTTISKEGKDETPSQRWRLRMLFAEHSPIRYLNIKWKWTDLKSWVSVHFVRHKIGIEHFVSTQRTDRTGINRDEKTQSSLVDHECIANAKAVINISRKRLCRQASKETREAWMIFLKQLGKRDAVLKSVCVPECIYRGFCPEFKSCGYSDSREYLEQLAKYRGLCEQSRS